MIVVRESRVGSSLVLSGVDGVRGRGGLGRSQVESDRRGFVGRVTGEHDLQVVVYRTITPSQSSHPSLPG